MDPQNAFQQPTSRRRLVLVIGLAAALLLLLGWGAWHKATTVPPKGKVSVLYSPPYISGVSISFSGKAHQATSSPANYNVAPGSYKLTISAPGYKTFSTTVPVTRDQTVLVNAQLTPLSSPTISGPADIVLPSGVKNLQIIDSQYFYSNSWAILHVNTDSDSNAVLVVRRDQVSGSWRVATGPGLGFGTIDVHGLPPLIQQYLNDHDYVVSGD